jgi:valyl-tRNA synthetase
MNEHAGRFEGLDRFEARRQIVEALEAEGLLEKIEDHQHAVGHCYRCDTVVEPYLSDQWFVRMGPLAKPALDAYRAGQLEFSPSTWGKTYEHWLENVRDWCISRQIWWGHRIPVWTCGNGHQFAAREDPERCPDCDDHELTQDPDVLDTWFSSWLWPFSTLGWPDETSDLKTYYPTQTLVTASEILFFWVARMVMAGIYCTELSPFENVVINGTVRDDQGRRMSKSAGNGIDPREMIDQFGTDALRYTLVTLVPTGIDLKLATDDFKVGRNFANKLWNAARFVFLNTPQGFEPQTIETIDRESLGDRERWLLERLDETIVAVDGHLEAFRLDEASNALREFLWHDYCDWAIEWSKTDLDGPDGDMIRNVLLGVLEQGLRLLHPIMPFVTEELWQRLPATLRSYESIMIAPWPEPQEWNFGPEAARVALLREVIVAARNLRSGYEVAPSHKAPLVIVVDDGEDRVALDRHAADVARLAGASEARVVAEAPSENGFVSLVVRGGVEVAVRLADLIDVERERERLIAESDRKQKQLAAVLGKLDNTEFVAKAPEQVVAREREKAADLERALERLDELLEALSPR